jgi:hypothetical protein
MLWNFRPNVPRGTFPLPFDAFHFVFHVKHVDTDANSDSSFHVELSSECVWILLGKAKRLRPQNVPRGTLECSTAIHTFFNLFGPRLFHVELHSRQ